MNDLQKKAFELLGIFVGICEKWDIPYYLVCGSALGAVKYQGFIPWDDDIDVGLLRKDYERFLKVAPGELPEWCFLQNYRTEPNFPHTFTKLRNSNTTFFEKSNVILGIHQGINIDIFPLDGRPEGRLAQWKFQLRQKIYNWMRFCVFRNDPNPRIRLRNALFRLAGFHRRIPWVQEKIECMYSAYPPEQSEVWCNYGNWQGKLEYAPKWHYGEGAWVTFEGLRVRIPENYDAYLTQKYGDWRSDPPLEKQKSHHISTIIDAEKPYTYYVNGNETA